MLVFNELDLEFFKKNGYLTNDFLCNNDDFLKISNELKLDLEKYINNNFEIIKKLGGFKSGNLNFISKNHSENIIRLLYKNNFKEYLSFLIKDDISTYELKLGGNLNFPKSKYQFFHTDGNWNPRMIVINIATSDINNLNGPLEIIEGSHTNKYPYWKFFLKNFFFKKRRLNLKKGEIIIREHRLWHRGTSNKSENIREMIGLMFIKKSYEKKKSFKMNGENLVIFSNIFGTSNREKLKEFIFLNLRFFFSMYKIIISIIK